MQQQVVPRRHPFSMPAAVASQYAQAQMHAQSIPGYPQHMHHQPPQMAPLDRRPPTMSTAASVPQSVAPHLPAAAPFQLSMAAAFLHTMAAHQPIHPTMTVDRRYLPSIESHMPQFGHSRRLPTTQSSHAAAAMAAIQAPLLAQWHMHSAASIAHPRIIAFQQ